MEKNKFSIVIPHLNEGYYLDIMLDSINSYINYDNYEIIIVDDGSDNLFHLDFLENHFLKDKITLYKKKGLGSHGARNFGASKASGEILIFLDSHMYVNTDILEEVNKIFITNSYISLLQLSIGSILEKNIKGEIYKIKNLLLNSNWDSCNEKNNLVETPNIAGGATIVKKDVFGKLGGFNRNFRKWGVEDIEFSMRAWLSGYKCYLAKDILIMHYFKESFKNTTVNNEDVLFNKIIFTLTCFSNKKRKNKILNKLKEYYGEIYEGIYDEVSNSKDIKKLIKKQKKYFIYDDDWYFEKFHIYYKEEFL